MPKPGAERESLLLALDGSRLLELHPPRQALLAALQLPEARGLVLGALGLELVGDGLLAGLLRLLLVDGLDQHALVLVRVTLDLEVQLVVEMAVDLLGLPGTEDLSEIF